ncbi:MAG: class I SAM-dependent methyltransferase [Oligoflexia bacterium]|nr:class I SAM-dependent methyltransferase [Oligoflexia bacterium]
MKIDELRVFFQNHKDPLQYEMRKTSSEAIDKAIGFEISKIENRILRRQDYENWSHIGCSRFSTPYEECQEILLSLDIEKNATLADLGAAYGRWGIVFKIFFPDGKFIGYEIEEERVKEGRRIFEMLGLANTEFFAADLKSIELPFADLYVIYDFGLQKDIEKILEKMKKLTHSFILIARGGSVRKIIEKNHPWLQTYRTKHSINYSIYYK